MTDGGEYLVRLRVVKDPLYPHNPRPMPLRLRAFLKIALRSFGFKAVSVEEIRPSAGASGDEKDGP